MTKKNARKRSARSHQAKHGVSYQSALRAQGPIKIKLKNDDPTPPEYDALALLNGGNSAIIEDDHCLMVVNRHYEKGPRGPERTELFKPTPWLFDEALTVLARLRSPDLDRRVREAFMTLNSGLYFQGHLAPTREQLMARIQDALNILGNDVPPTDTGFIPRPKPLEGFSLVPTEVKYEVMPTEKPWITDTMTPGPSGYVRIIVEEKHHLAGTKLHNRLTFTLLKKGNDETMMRDIDSAVKRLRPSWSGWSLVQTEPEQAPMATSEIFRAQYPGEPLPPGMIDARKTTPRELEIDAMDERIDLSLLDPDYRVAARMLRDGRKAAEATNSFMVSTPEEVYEWGKNSTIALQRCTAPRLLMLGITDSKTVRWTTLPKARAATIKRLVVDRYEDVRFLDWWHTLPQADPYARFDNDSA